MNAFYIPDKRGLKNYRSGYYRSSYRYGTAPSGARSHRSSGTYEIEEQMAAMVYDGVLVEVK